MGCGHSSHPGEGQLGQLLDARSGFAYAAESTLIAHGIAAVLSGANTTAAERAEVNCHPNPHLTQTLTLTRAQARARARARARAQVRRTVDALLVPCAGVLASVLGRQRAAQLLGVAALLLAPAALARMLVGSALVGVVARLSLGVAAGGGLWRLSRASEHERRHVRRSLLDARARAVAGLAPHVGGSEKAARWLNGGTLLLFQPMAATVCIQAAALRVQAAALRVQTAALRVQAAALCTQARCCCCPWRCTTPCWRSVARHVGSKDRVAWPAPLKRLIG